MNSAAARQRLRQHSARERRAERARQAGWFSDQSREVTRADRTVGL